MMPLAVGTSILGVAYEEAPYFVLRTHVQVASWKTCSCAALAGGLGRVCTVRVETSVKGVTDPWHLVE